MYLTSIHDGDVILFRRLRNETRFALLLTSQTQTPGVRWQRTLEGGHGRADGVPISVLRGGDGGLHDIMALFVGGHHGEGTYVPLLMQSMQLRGRQRLCVLRGATRLGVFWITTYVHVTSLVCVCVCESPNVSGVTSLCSWASKSNTTATL